MSYTRSFPHRGERLTARIIEEDGVHIAEITSTTPDTGTHVIWSRVFRTESVATITAQTVTQFDTFVACRLPQA